MSLTFLIVVPFLSDTKATVQKDSYFIVTGTNLGANINDISVGFNNEDITTSCVMVTPQEFLICQSPDFGAQIQYRLELYAFVNEVEQTNVVYPTKNLPTPANTPHSTSPTLLRYLWEYKRELDYNPGDIIFGTNAELAASLLISGASTIVQSITVILKIDVHGMHLGATISV